MFFLNDSLSDLSSSTSEDGMSHAHYLLQHAKAMGNVSGLWQLSALYAADLLDGGAEAADGAWTSYYVMTRGFV